MTFKRWIQRTLNRMRGIPLVLCCAALAVACGAPVGAEAPAGWELSDVIAVPTDAPCYEVFITASQGRDLPVGMPDVVRIVRPAWGDALPGGLGVRAEAGEDIHVYTLGGADANVISMVALSGVCR